MADQLYPHTSFKVTCLCVRIQDIWQMMLHSAPLAHLTADSIWVSIFTKIFGLGSKRRVFYSFFAIDCVSAIQGHPSSMIVASIESALWDFLLVCHSNHGPVLHLFWYTATYWLKIAVRSKVYHEEARVTGLFSSEDRMIVVWVILIQYERVTDRQADGQTDLYFNIASTAPSWRAVDIMQYYVWTY